MLKVSVKKKQVSVHVIGVSGELLRGKEVDEALKSISAFGCLILRWDKWGWAARSLSSLLTEREWTNSLPDPSAYEGYDMIRAWVYGEECNYCRGSCSLVSESEWEINHCIWVKTENLVCLLLLTLSRSCGDLRILFCPTADDFINSCGTLFPING